MIGEAALLPIGVHLIFICLFPGKYFNSWMLAYLTVKNTFKCAGYTLFSGYSKMNSN